MTETKIMNMAGPADPALTELRADQLIDRFNNHVEHEASIDAGREILRRLNALREAVLCGQTPTREQLIGASRLLHIEQVVYANLPSMDLARVDQKILDAERLALQG